MTLKHFALLLVLVLSAAAQTETLVRTATSETSDTVAVAKLDISYQLFAGTAAPRDVRMSGTVVNGDRSGTFTYESTVGGRSKLQLFFPDDTITEIASGYGEAPRASAWVRCRTRPTACSPTPP